MIVISDVHFAQLKDLKVGDIKFFVKSFFGNAYKKHSTLICFLLWVSVLFAFRIAGSWVVSRIPLDV